MPSFIKKQANIWWTDTHLRPRVVSQSTFFLSDKEPYNWEYFLYYLDARPSLQINDNERELMKSELIKRLFIILHIHTFYNVIKATFCLHLHRALTGVMINVLLIVSSISHHFIFLLFFILNVECTFQFDYYYKKYCNKYNEAHHISIFCNKNTSNFANEII